MNYWNKKLAFLSHCPHLDSFFVEADGLCIPYSCHTDRVLPSRCLPLSSNFRLDGVLRSLYSFVADITEVCFWAVWKGLSNFAAFSIDAILICRSRQDGSKVFLSRLVLCLVRLSCWSFFVVWGIYFRSGCSYLKIVVFQPILSKWAHNIFFLRIYWDLNI